MQHRSTCSCSRRSFLRGAGMTLTGFGLTSLFPRPLIQHALAGTLNDRRLLFLFLRGGNDGLHCVIPHGDPQYSATIRPTLYVPPAQALDLNGFASLHPSMGDMMDIYDAGELAVIHRVGYPGSSQSHFDGQRIWENGDPTQPQLFEGWLYRHIQETMLSAAGDLPVLSVQSSPPVLLRGDEKFVNVANPDDFDYVIPEPTRSKTSAVWNAVSGELDGVEAYRSILSQTGVNLADTLDEYDSWDQQNWNPMDPDTGWHLFPVDFNTNPDDPQGPGGKKFAGTSYPFFRSLKVCALALLESDGSTNATRIAGTQLSGWDLHGNQGQLDGAHAELMSWVAYGFRSLRIALSGAAIDNRNYGGIWDKTTVVTLSEFGRTTEENGSFGTDHAAASCMFLAGGPVNGGVYNCDPSTWPAGVMFGINGRYLQERTDFRSVFWEILRDQMGAAPGTADGIFPGYTSLGLGSQELGLIGV